jgi:hypothetical protein
MTARKEPAVKGRDTGWWYDDEPSALRRGENGQEGVSSFEKGKNVVTGRGEKKELEVSRVQPLLPRDGKNGVGKSGGVNNITKDVAVMGDGKSIRKATENGGLN